MPFTISDLELKTDLPDIPDTIPVAVLASPCAKERSGSARRLAEILDLEVAGTVDVPHGYAVGGSHGQVEVFTASGAIRARNTDRLSAYPDERRKWADAKLGDDGFQLGKRSTEQVTRSAMEILERSELRDNWADLDVVLGQWALLDEKGNELESGPGRATVRLSYAAEGIPLIGPGAKTHLHFDPDEEGAGGLLARFFHVHRAVEASTDVATQSLEEAFEPLLTQSWAGLEVDPSSARLSITSAKLGLLALPADVAQGFAAPALAVEGQLAGAVAADGRELTVGFGQYIALAHPKSLASSGLATTGPLVHGEVVRRRGKGE